jgi:hypothetical protein
LTDWDELFLVLLLVRTKCVVDLVLLIEPLFPHLQAMFILTGGFLSIAPNNCPQFEHVILYTLGFPPFMNLLFERKLLTDKYNNWGCYVRRLGLLAARKNPGDRAT